jgi:SagB-type dehydrogenase family enzyme
LNEDIGERFWADTKHRRDSMFGRTLDWDSRPDTYKEYPTAKIVPLPAPPMTGMMSFDDVVSRRHSGRRYSNEAIPLETLSYLLWTSTGINRRERGHELRNAPSAGALYPIETYLCVNRVDGALPGLYHYNIRRHALEMVHEGESGANMARAALDQEMVQEAGAAIIWTAMFERSRWKYGQRCYRYVHLDAGHIAQNLALACAASDIACCHIAAFYDDEVNALLRIDGKEESAIYMSSVGRNG